MADRRPRWATLFLVAGLLAAACSEGDSEAYADALPTPSAATGDETPKAAAESRDAPADDTGDDVEWDDDYLFDQSKLHTFELNLNAEDLAFLDADPAAEEYVEGTLTFEGETIPVGIRYKGSIGAWVGCIAGERPLQPDGEKTCTKLSMKIKINWENGDDEFLGVRKLQLHSMNHDISQMHERLGYWLMREMHIPGPRSTHARVVVNGEFVGLFALTENLDGRFTRAQFDDGSGNLYKEAWPFTLEGAVTAESILVGALRTNENDPKTNALMMRRFATELLEAEDPAAVVGRWMDVEATMNYLAVDRTISHDDGPFHWYCGIPADRGASEDECGPHNFFFYENPSTGQISIVPWDVGSAFSNIIEPSNRSTPIPDGLGDITAACDIFIADDTVLAQRSASCDPLFAAWASMEDEYHAAVQRLHDGPLRPEVLDPLLEEWTAQIKQATLDAAAAHDDALDPDAWAWGLDQLREQLEHARSNPIGS